ncbi:MAG: DotU family type IV/VI secretion system protein [Gammaproteobacteria bacterium]|nr:DotU family type IV/VI secretion system protein [Gammaproteobacteria bacterium]
MSIGFQVAVAAIPFFELLDQEEESLAAQVAESGDPSAVTAAMDASRRRLAQGVDAVVRSLPAAVRADLTASRAVAYALVGLVDGRMLHHPTGGLDRWRDRLMEFELYGSALAGQEVVAQARAAAQGIAEGATPAASDPVTLAPFYLAVFRAGFEGSLRADTVGLASLVASLEEAVGVRSGGSLEAASDVRPRRAFLAPLPLAALGVAAWLVAGVLVWFALSSESLGESDRMAERIAAGLPAAGTVDPLRRSVGPSGLPPVGDDQATGP